MGRVAALIRFNNPDIIHLAEVENLTALKKFNEAFLAGIEYDPFLINGRDTATGEDVALFTRLDPELMRRDDRVGHNGAITKRVSKNYIATFTFGEIKVALIGLHLLSMREDWRQGPERAVKG